MSAPPPPADLAAREPEFLQIAEDAILERFYTAAHEPIHFDRGSNGRLNAPDGSYGVLYAAAELRGAFAETFLRLPGRTLLPIDFVRKKAHVRLRVTRVLTLIQLHGYGLARVGATAETVHGGLPYDVPRAWSRALRDHPSRPDGLAYTARHDDSAMCFALFDHPPPCVVEHSRDVDLDADWFWALAERYGVGIAP